MKNYINHILKHHTHLNKALKINALHLKIYSKNLIVNDLSYQILAGNCPELVGGTEGKTNQIYFSITKSNENKPNSD